MTLSDRMRNPAILPRILLRSLAILLLPLVALGLFGLARAQAPGPVQVLAGNLTPGEFLAYRLSGLERGQTLYAYLRGTSGNLDPVMGLVEAGVDLEALEAEYLAAIQRATAEGRDPLLAAKQAAGSLFLAWDDDSGEGLAATLAFPVPADGDYRLLVSSALSAFGSGTFGGYQLIIGLDVPEVILGQTPPEYGVLAEAEIAVLDREASAPREAVQEITGTLSAEGDTLQIRDLRPDDRLYVFAEAISGDLRPSLVLHNFADKPLRAANLDGQALQASLEYTVEEDVRNYELRLRGCCTDGASGEYRLLVGVNRPEVLTGQALAVGQPVIEAPITVQIGLKLQQIVEVDEPNERFTMVGSLQMEWTDPRLAFDPGSCDCVFKTYTRESFDQFAAGAGGLWPDFTFLNQQGNRWTQNRVVILSHAGQALYFERFSTDLQLDFDFRRYPFDTQEFVVHIDSIYPEEFYQFADLEGYSEISTDHGEDEFLISDFETEVTSQQASTRATSSRFTFRFSAPRHVNYYILQIFVPILLIFAVSWVTFFLRDYGRRIEVASANLLVFIAYSFSLADNYPRLGYITLLDAFMVITFIVNSLVVVYNVGLRRLEMDGQADQAERIDNFLDWLYPIALLVAAGILYLLFF